MLALKYFDLNGAVNHCAGLSPSPQSLCALLVAECASNYLSVNVVASLTVSFHETTSEPRVAFAYKPVIVGSNPCEAQSLPVTVASCILLQ